MPTVVETISRAQRLGRERGRERAFALASRDWGAFVPRGPTVSIVTERRDRDAFTAGSEGRCVWLPLAEARIRVRALPLGRPPCTGRLLLERRAHKRRDVVAGGMTRRRFGLLPVATTFAAYLSAYRRTAPTYVATEPLDDALWVDVPHLVACWDDREIADTVLWEVADRAFVERWFGVELARVVDARGQLGGLLRLRRRLRERSLPRSGACQELIAVLGRSRYLSFKFATEHPQLVRAAIAEVTRA